MKLGSLFDGSGGFPLAAVLCGIEPVWVSEIEPFPIRVTTKRLPHMKHCGDISQMSGAEVEPVDIVTFGSPCQDLSVAGRRAGMDGERSGLFHQAIRIIKEMRAKTNGVHPRFAIWENVPGAFSSNGGEDFRAVLEAFCQTADPAADVPRPAKWTNAGLIMADNYSVAWRLLDAQYWGVPQRRRRIFLVADFAGQRAGEILFKPDSLPRHFTESRSEGEEAAVTVAGGIGKPKVAYGICSKNSNSMLSNNPHSGVYEATTARTLDANGGNPTCNQGGIAIVEKEVAAAVDCLQGSMIGRAEKNGPQGDGINEDVSFTLNTIDRHAVAHHVFSQQRSDEYCANSVVSTQNARQYKDATDLIIQRPNVSSTTSYTPSSYGQYQEGVGTLRGSGGDLGGGSENITCSGYGVRRLTPTEGVGTLKASGGDAGPGSENIVVKAVDCRNLRETELCNTLQAKESGGYSLNYQNPVRIGYAVRRLTPTECARLQGFPDWWATDLGTDSPNESDIAFWAEVFETHRQVIGTSGKPKSRAQIIKWLKNPHSDSAEYKMWGNGVALPCVVYVLQGIVGTKVKPEARTESILER